MSPLLRRVALSTKNPVRFTPTGPPLRPGRESKPTPTKVRKPSPSRKRYLIPTIADSLLPLPSKSHEYYPRLSPSRARQEHLFVVNPRRHLPKGTDDQDHELRVNMLSFVDIVSTPTVDTPGACLRLFFDNRHYIFGNVAEGTQRIMASKRMGMAKVEDIFLSGPVDWHANGGLLGFLLTIADVHETISGAVREANKERAAKGKKLEPIVGIDHINIHGAKNLTHMLATGRRFVWRKAFPLVPLEVRNDPRVGVDAKDSDKPDWEDKNIRVWYVPVESHTAAPDPSMEVAQPSKSKKRKRRAEHMSDSDGEGASVATLQSQQQPEVSAAESSLKTKSSSTLSQDDADQQMREAIVEQMFNSQGSRNVTRSTQNVQLLEEMRFGEVTPWRRSGVFFRDEDGNVKPYTGQIDVDAMVLVPKNWSASLVQYLPPVERSQVSMCYVVKLHPGKGKFNAQKAAELGVQKRDNKLLVDGQTVLGKDGVEVTPEMVISPPPDPSGFALVEVPDKSYIASLLARPEWENEKIMGGLASMYWIVRDPEVLSDERVQSFMREHSTLKHTVLSKTDGGSPCLVQNSTIERTRLNMIESDLFPSVSHTDGDGSWAKQQDPTLPYEQGITGAQLRLRPTPSHNNDNLVSPPKEGEIMARFVGDPEILRLAAEAKAKVSDPSFLSAMAEAASSLPNPDTEIIPLGTGSALPSRSRNVSCTLIRIPGIGSYLLDCGENSLGQLRRMYGYAGADEVLRDLKAIWISHSHADHHLGTVSVLRRFSEVVPLSTSPEQQQKVAVIAHPLYHQFLAEYAQIEPLGLDTHIVLLSNARPIAPPSPANSFNRDLLQPMDDPEILSPFGLSSIAICKVDHCDDSRAVALTFTSGLKIAYSGDCRPSRSFATDPIGGGAHLLIHEATLDDDLQKDAVAKKHCTISEALGVARDMRARNVLLTHFSQRYPRLPEMKNAGDERKGDAPVVFAFDFMRVRLGEFRKAREFVPALQRLLAEEEKAPMIVEDETVKKEGEKKEKGKNVKGEGEKGKNVKKEGEKKEKGNKQRKADRRPETTGVKKKDGSQGKKKGGQEVATLAEELVEKVPDEKAATDEKTVAAVEEMPEQVVLDIEDQVMQEKTADV